MYLMLLIIFMTPPPPFCFNHLSKQPPRMKNAENAEDYPISILENGLVNELLYLKQCWFERRVKNIGLKGVLENYTLLTISNFMSLALSANRVDFGLCFL